MGYVGRFAPSPSGPLHYGSLVAALASYLDARHADGQWLLRIEDLDPPRESASAPAEILHQLKTYGLHWDGDVLYQSHRQQAYLETLGILTEQNLTYPCTCSRKQIPAIYPGTCRNGCDATKPYAIRMRLPTLPLEINDRLRGKQQWDPADVGDFIVRRKDQLFAYQLAVVVDDIHQGVNQIVRGIDLLDSTPRQLAIYHCLHETPPAYLHIPVITEKDGNKLSKQAHAAAIDTDRPIETLLAALTDLGQPRPTTTGGVDRILASAAAKWNIERIPKSASITVSDLFSQG